MVKISDLESALVKLNLSEDKIQDYLTKLQPLYDSQDELCKKLNLTPVEVDSLFESYFSSYIPMFSKTLYESQNISNAFDYVINPAMKGFYMKYDIDIKNIDEITSTVKELYMSLFSS